MRRMNPVVLLINAQSAKKRYHPPGQASVAMSFYEKAA